MSLSSANRTLQLASRLLDSRTTTEPIVEFGPQKPEIPLGRSAQPLPEVTPETEGIPSAHIAAFLNTLDAEPTLHMHSVLILRHGNILCRSAFGAQRTDLPRQTYSACKSITALAVGLAMDDGLLRPDDRVTELLPEACGPVSRRMLKELTVEHLLSMTANITFSEGASMTSRDWTRAFLSSPGMGEQGKRFQYNSLNTYLLTVLVCKVTGKTLTQLLTERLFHPMGIADFYWETSPEGIEKGGWGLYMRPEDLAKLGLLVQNDGVWQGRQLISQDFLQKAVSVHAEVPIHYGDFNYGWQIWVGRRENSFLFNGMLGQNVLCYRDSGVMIVSHAGNDESFQQSRYYALVSQYFGGSFPPKLPKSPAGERQLHRALRLLQNCTAPLPNKDAFAQFAGRRFVTEDPHAASAGILPLLLQGVSNNYSHGLQAVAIGGSRSLPQLFYEERDQLHRLLIGTQSPQLQTLSYHGDQYQIAVQGRFTHDEDDNPVLRIRIDFLETPCTRILKLILTPAGILLRQQEQPGAGFVLHLTDQASLSPAARSVIGALMGSSDPDYPKWKLTQLFSPTLDFREEL